MRMKSGHAPTPLAVLIGAMLFSTTGCATEAPAGAAEVLPPAQAAPGDVWLTAHTQRLPGRDAIEQAIRVSEFVYAATRNEDRPDAVLLARVDRPAHAILAVNRLIHFPTNAPLLFVEANRLPPATRAELERLRPEGMFADANVQVYAVGDVGEAVLDELNDMGLKVRHFAGTDPFLIGEAMDSWSGAVHGDHPDEVVIVPIDSLSWALPFSAWNAHMGHGFFFVTRDSVPAATARALTRRFGKPYIFLIGNEEMASAELADQLTDFGYVERLGQDDVHSLSAFFAGYRDDGRNFGWWLGETPRGFGWGIQESGHNYTFANPADPMVALPGSILSHIGRHGPMLLVESDRIPEAVASYLEKVRPGASRPAIQKLNLGQIIGDSRRISNALQAEIDERLSPQQPGLPEAAPPIPVETPVSLRDTTAAPPDTAGVAPDTSSVRTS